MPAKKLTCLLNKAEKGDTKAQFDLAVRLYNGDGIKRNYEAAEKWYRLAAENGDMHAQCDLGYMYYEGSVGKTDYIEASKWYRLSAQQGLSEAKRLLSLLLCEGGYGVEEDLDESIDLCEQAVAQGNLLAMENLASIYTNTGSRPRNIIAAKELLFRASDHGSENAQWNLVYLFFHDKVFLADKSALDKFKIRISVPRYERAQAELGRIYYDGGYVMQDYAEAVRWFSLAADRGDAESLFYLGVMYSEGKGLEQDYVKARECLLKAAEKTNSAAYHYLGQIYANGTGVTQDYNEALKWYRLAVRRGHSGSCVALGKMFAEGRGVKKNYSRAVKWYRVAADRWDEDAMYNLGALYAEGRGVKQDFDEALKWSERAIESGYVPEPELFEKIEFAYKERSKQFEKLKWPPIPIGAWDSSKVIIIAYGAIKHVLSFYRHSFTKHIIIVPSIADGKELFGIMTEMAAIFLGDYAERIHFFLYSRSHVELLEKFSAENEDIDVLIIDAGALNPTALDSTGSSFMYSTNQKLQGRRPIDVIKGKQQPVILHDEGDGVGKKTPAIIADLNPKMVWKSRYSEDMKNDKLPPIDVAEAFIKPPPEEMAVKIQAQSKVLNKDWVYAPF
jgi:uncharacterized protein